MSESKSLHQSITVILRNEVSSSINKWCLPRAGYGLCQVSIEQVAMELSMRMDLRCRLLPHWCCLGQQLFGGGEVRLVSPGLTGSFATRQSTSALGNAMSFCLIANLINLLSLKI